MEINNNHEKTFKYLKQQKRPYPYYNEFENGKLYGNVREKK